MKYRSPNELFKKLTLALWFMAELFDGHASDSTSGLNIEFPDVDPYKIPNCEVNELIGCLRGIDLVEILFDEYVALSREARELRLRRALRICETDPEVALVPDSEN